MLKTARNLLLIFLVATLISPQWVEGQVGVLRAARALLADGTSSAPAYSWANDADLGAWRIGADEQGHAGSLAIRGPRPWVDVRAYGAKGDGVTDDDAAIQAAIDAAPVGARIFAPPGTYLFSRDVRLKSGIELFGMGWKTVFKRKNSSTQDPGQVGHGRMLNLDSSGMPYSDVHLHDFVIDCNAANNTITVAPLEAYSVQRFTIERLRVLDSDATMYIPNPNQFVLALSDLDVKNLHIEKRAADPLTEPVDVLIHGNTIRNAKVFGIGVNGGKRLRVSQNTILSLAPTATSAGIDVDGSIDVTITGNVINGNTNGGGIYVASGLRISITGNTIFDVTAAGIQTANELDSATNVGNITISGNVIRKAGAGIQVDSMPEGTIISGNYIREINGKGILFEYQSGSTRDSAHAVISGNLIFDYAKTEAFQGAITANRLDDSLIIGNIFDGNNNVNVRGVIFGTTSTNNRVQGNIFRNLTAEKVLDNGTGNEFTGNKGFVTENNVLSGTFAIDATGIKTVTIAHGLSYTPSKEHCQLTVLEETNVDDWAYNLLKVDTVDATNVTAKINVSTASATGAATAKLALRCQKH